MKNINITVLVVFLNVPFQGAISQTSQSHSINMVTTAVPFLRISADPITGAMGDAGIATRAETNAAFLNKAKLPFANNNSGISLNYAPWLRNLGLNDVYLVSLAGYKKLDERQALSSSLRYFSLGNIQFTDYQGNDLKTYNPREFAIDLGYSMKLSNKLGLGIALRYINSNLSTGQSNGANTYKTGNSVAGDLSIFHDGVNEKKKGSGINWGIVLSNLGSKISYTNNAAQKDYIPANMGLGLAYIKKVDDHNRISFGFDVNKLLVPTPPASGDSAGMVNYYNKSVVSSWFSSFDNKTGGLSETIKEFQFSVGAEYVYRNIFALRAGYFYENEQKGNRKYFTMGTGLKYNRVGVDFSYLIPSNGGLNKNPLSNTLRFGLTFNLDHLKKKQL